MGGSGHVGYLLSDYWCGLVWLTLVLLDIGVAGLMVLQLDRQLDLNLLLRHELWLDPQRDTAREHAATLVLLELAQDPVRVVLLGPT